MKKYDAFNLVITVGEVYGVEEFYDYLGEDFHDAVSFEDFLKNDVAYNNTCLLDEEGFDRVIEYTDENVKLTITNIY